LGLKFVPNFVSIIGLALRLKNVKMKNDFASRLVKKINPMIKTRLETNFGPKPLGN
jgi:hypothetical protein